MKSLADLRIKIFADEANLSSMVALSRLPYIRGFTTNPTLMRKAGITDYRIFAKMALVALPNLPISFEVFADDMVGMERQARKIASWGMQVYVKIPVTNTKGESTYDLVHRLSYDGIKVNVTAVMTKTQVLEIAMALDGGVASYVSIFAGRIADTGRDPMPLMTDIIDLLCSIPSIELIWASPRELFNIYQADEIGCHIITATTDILNKRPFVGKNLTEYSLETVQMFHNDAQQAGYKL